MPLAALFQLASLLREAGSRILGLPDLVGSFAGVRLRKKLRLRLVVLRDAQGMPVVPEHDVEEALAEARAVLAQEAQIDIVPVGERLIDSPDEPSPPHALESPCGDQGLWRTDLGPAGAFFRARLASSSRASPLGYGAPVTVFVVRDVLGKCGCSLGPLGDYVTIDRGGLGRGNRILAHELGHSCGLRHRREEDNLMRPRRPGERLTRWQQAVFRTSRHVTYL